jgi:Zn finger protein HypA/HybF involved in hydrogenase expression
VTELRQLNRTLEQELNALLRGASLECLVCGEFVLHRRGSILCPECGAELGSASGAAASSRLQLGSQAG